jgi:hypothetical protein
MSRGRRSTAPFQTARMSSYRSSPGVITSPRKPGIVVIGVVIIPPSVDGSVDGLIATSEVADEKSAIWTSK